MPLTIPTHPAAVLPLKLWRPRWFDGVALVMGSIAPDLAYALDGSGLPVWPFSHEVAGLFGWCLPIVFLGTWVIRGGAAVTAAHLPNLGPLALRDYGALGTVRHRWWITATSGLAGAASHLLLDVLEDSVPAGPYVLHGLGIVVLALGLWRIGRERLIRRWNGPVPAMRSRPALFWSVAALVAVPLVAVTPYLPGASAGRETPLVIGLSMGHTSAVRVLCAVAGAFLVAAYVTRRVGLRNKLGEGNS